MSEPSEQTNQASTTSQAAGPSTEPTVSSASECSTATAPIPTASGGTRPGTPKTHPLFRLPWQILEHILGYLNPTDLRNFFEALRG
ncbi:hypothetical protein F5Y02DRAFT_414821 [Annulohypoxylon stygium]|nr:hypothetical protein F5Y02DRAFT_414821 [Annulohypoxylon stygium]